MTSQRKYENINLAWTEFEFSWHTRARSEWFDDFGSLQRDDYRLWVKVVYVWVTDVDGDVGVNRFLGWGSTGSGWKR